METLVDKAKKLRAHFGMDNELPVATVVSAAIDLLGLHVEGGLLAKADACISALNKAPPVSVEAVPQQPIIAMGSVVIREAEAAMRLQEAEMKARTAEQALAQQSRMAALERALRDAMPGWFGVWTGRGVDGPADTATLQTAIAQAEAAFPPAGSSLQAALLEAKAALRSQEEAKAKKEAEERARREAEERARREAEERERAEERVARIETYISSTGSEKRWQHVTAEERSKARSLAQSGAIEETVSWLRASETDSRLAARGCLALNNLVRCDDSATKRCGQAGGCSIVTLVMRRYPEDVTVALWGCCALLNLCDDNASNAKAICASNGYDAVVTALRVLPEAHKEYACWALWNMIGADRSSKQQAIDAGACEAIVRVLPRQPNESTVGLARCGCGAVMILALDNPAAAQRLGRAGACEVIVSTLKSSVAQNTYAEVQGGADLATPACWAVANLAWFDKSEHSQQRFQEMDAKAALQKYTNSGGKLAEAANKAIENL